MWKGKLAGGRGELREAVGEVLPCPWSQWTAQPGVLWWNVYRKCVKVLPKSVDCQQEVFFLVVCWGIGFYSGLFFFPSLYNLGFITGFSQNRTVGVGKTHKLLMMIL